MNPVCNIGYHYTKQKREQMTNVENSRKSVSRQSLNLCRIRFSYKIC